jgi:type II secretory pathway component GspD/PulD (secretin)
VAQYVTADSSLWTARTYRRFLTSFAYCPSCVLIAASIFSLTAEKLKEAGLAWAETRSRFAPEIALDAYWDRMPQTLF